MVLTIRPLRFSISVWTMKCNLLVVLPLRNSLLSGAILDSCASLLRDLPRKSQPSSSSLPRGHGGCRAGRESVHHVPPHPPPPCCPTQPRLGRTLQWLRAVLFAGAVPAGYVGFAQAHGRLCAAALVRCWGALPVRRHGRCAAQLVGAAAPAFGPALDCGRSGVRCDARGCQCCGRCRGFLALFEPANTRPVIVKNCQCLTA